MSNGNNTVQTLAVIALGAAIGFGAVYAISLGGNNARDGDSAAEATPAPRVPVASRDASGRQVQSIPFETSKRLKDLGKAAAADAKSTTASPPASAEAAVLTGPDGDKLNRGDMVTFVFKNQPMALPAASFNGPEGQAMGFEDLKGKVLLVNLWATWCAPCRKEMPYLNKLQQELGSNDFEVVAVSVDRGSVDKSRKFLDEVGATALKLYHDPSAQLGFTLKAIGMPSTLLIDRQGREIGRLVGPAEWHSDDAKRLIRAAIASR